MFRLRSALLVLLPLSLLLGGTAANAAPAKPLAAPKNVQPVALSSTSISVTFSTVSGAASYTAYLYTEFGKTAEAYSNATPSGTTISGLTQCTTYRVSVQAISSTPSRSSVQSGKMAVTTECPATAPSSWIGAGDFTIEGWVKAGPNFSSGRQELIVLTNSARNARLDIWYNGGIWTGYIESWANNTRMPEGAASAADWVHLALTRSGSTVSLYVGGQLVDSVTASGSGSGLNVLMLGADPNNPSCHCNLASAYLAQVRIVDGTALYSGASFAVPTSPLTAVTGTTFLLNTAIGDASAGSVVLDGATRYQQEITIVDTTPSLSTFGAYTWNGSIWSDSTVVTSADKPN